MKRIGLLSDTHGYLDQRIFHHFENCDEIWYAGDIGNLAVSDDLSAIKPFVAVFGNIDGREIRMSYPEIQRFKCEDVEVLIKHIGGYPGNYDWSIKEEIHKNPPKLFISGHSHILKVMPDKKNGLLHINPGAAGKNGIHKVRTIVRFIIDKENIGDMEVIELEQRY